MDFNWDNVWDIFKIIAPALITFVVWAFNFKRNNQIKKLNTLKNSKGIITDREYNLLKRKISNEIVSVQTKVKDDGYLNIGVFLISHNVMSWGEFFFLKELLWIRNSKFRIKISKGYVSGYYLVAFTCFLTLFVIAYYLYMLLKAISSISSVYQSEDSIFIFYSTTEIFLILFAIIVSLKFFSVLRRLLVSAERILSINIKLNKIIVPEDLLCNLKDIIKMKKSTKMMRLTKSKALRIIRSVILPLHRH